MGRTRIILGEQDNNRPEENKELKALLPLPDIVVTSTETESPKMASEEGDEIQNLITKVIESAEAYINSDATADGDILGDTYESLTTLSRIVDQLYKAHAAGEEMWNLMLQQRPYFCKLYLSVLDLINASARGDTPLTSGEILALLPKITLSISSGSHTRSNHKQRRVRLLVERLFAQLASLVAGVNVTELPTILVSLPTKSPKKSLIKSPNKSPKQTSPRNVLDPRSPRIGAPKEDDPVTTWYFKPHDAMKGILPRWVFIYHAAIIITGLAICCGCYYWLIGHSIYSLSPCGHESVPDLPVIFPNGTSVGFEMSNKLEAYNMHMQNTVKLYESAETNTHHVVASFIIQTEKFAHALEMLTSPPWYSPVLKLFGIKQPQKQDAEHLALDFGSEVSRILHNLSAEEKDQLKNSLDQLDANLYRIQTSILGHDVKLQLSQFFHDLSHLQLSAMFEGIAEQDLSKSLATLKMFNEKYRQLGEGLVFTLHEKIEGFVRGWNDMMSEDDKVPERIHKLRNLSWELREGSRGAMELRLSLDGVERKENNQEL